MNRNIANRVWTGIDSRWQVRGWHGTPYWLARNEFGIPEPRREIGVPKHATMTVSKARQVVQGRTANALKASLTNGEWSTTTDEPVVVLSFSITHPVRVGFNPSWFAGLNHIAADHNAELRLDAYWCSASWWRDDRILAMLAGYYSPVRQIAKAAA